MGRTTLQWSPIQLRMEDQHIILHMGRLQGVTINIEGTSAQADIEVIEIFDDNNPYYALLGINWATDMNGVINLKNHKLTFEKRSQCVVVPLDPADGERYNEPVCDDDSDDDLNCIYKITAREQDWVNPTADKRISWERESSCTSDSDGEIERWQNQLHKVTTLNCNMMMRLMRCISMEVRELPMYDGLSEVDDFLNRFEREVSEQQRFEALKWVLCATTAR